jgi:chromosomal replication initiator protein
MSELGGWEAVRVAVRQRVGEGAFRAWFEGLEGRVVGGDLVIECPDRFSSDWIRRRYGEAIEEVAGGYGRVQFNVRQGGAARVASTARKVARQVAQPVLPEPLLLAARPAPEPEPAPARGGDMAFDTFVVGPNNAIAHAAARAVARGGDGRCNPLFLAGGPGLGKSHLARSIQETRISGVVYRSSEEFTTEVTQAMRSGKMEVIRSRYRKSVNVLILEDVQFLRGKTQTQIELFHTIDHLIRNGKSVVLTGDRHPRDIQGLDEQLQHRMNQGFVARLGEPDHETKLHILRSKAASGGVRVPEDGLHLLAARGVRNVGELLSGLNQVVARASLLKRPITTELVCETLNEREVTPVGGQSRTQTVAEIMAVCAKAYSMNVDLLCGRSRLRRVVRPRQFAMYLCRKYTNASLKEIGRAFDRDHTSVMHAVKAIEQRALEQPQLRYELEALVSRFGSPSAKP